MFFRVKAGRWYRVFTDNLAPGVDTVLAVGDLSPSTPCQPAGCWNDDRAALTYASEVVFQAVEDDIALVTVDNFGSRYGTDATYEVGVQEFIPESTPTVTPPPSATPTVTPTASTTPPPFKDPSDQLQPADSCATAWPLDFSPFEGTIHRSQDQDWFLTIPLPVGEYIITLVPPDGVDYDLAIRNAEEPSRNRCTVITSRTSGGDTPEEYEFSVAPGDDGARAVFVVYPATATDVDAHNPYVLHLRPRAPLPTPTFTPTPSPSVAPPPTATRTPTISAPLPTP
jgi:hypothetical protein